MKYFLISDRKNVYETQSVSQNTHYIHFEDGREIVSSSNQIELANERTLVLVHGYNNTSASVFKAYQTIQKKIEQLLAEDVKYTTVVGYMWPGYENRIAYHPARMNAHIIAPRLGHHLSSLLSNGSVDVMAHSMGNRVLFESLEHINSAKQLGNIFSLAAAVDNESIEEGEDYYTDIVERVEQLYVFHSRRDLVLRYGYQMGELDKALGYNGPENPSKISSNTSVYDMTDLIDGHSNYRYENRFYEMMNQILTKQPVAV